MSKITLGTEKFGQLESCLDLTASESLLLLLFWCEMKSQSSIATSRENLSGEREFCTDSGRSPSRIGMHIGVSLHANVGPNYRLMASFTIGS